MVRASGVFSLLSALLLFGGLLAGSGRAEVAAPVIGPKDVWTVPEKPWQACLDRQPPVTDCLTRVMYGSKATHTALEINRVLEGDGYMSEFREMGRVDLATMTFPLRANTNEADFCVNGKPPMVSTELTENAVNITADPAYARLRKAFPKMELWPSSARFRSMDIRPGGGQAFVFAYPLLNGCHACELAGYALIALDFGPDGTYRGPRLLRLEPAGR